MHRYIELEKNPLSLLLKIIKASRKVDSFIMLPAQNGVHIFSSLLLIFKKNLYYSVIGGWLPKITGENSKLKNKLLKFDGIWVETDFMYQALKKQGFTNIKIVPNFKVLEPINAGELSFGFDKPYKFCTFSRVLKEKGIEDAVSVITRVNNEYGIGTAELDIYGVIDAGYVKEFECLKSQFPEYIMYKGVVPYDKTSCVLKEYFALLFPTHYYTEGIPGTIIDAYAAGIPILSAKWESFENLIKEGITGYGFKFDDSEAFYELVKKCIDTPKMISDLKTKCIEEYQHYTDTYAFSIIEKELDK